MTETTKCRQCGADVPEDAPEGLCPRCLMRLVLPDAVDPSTPHRAKLADRQPPSPQELAKKLPHLEIMELLGRGGMGIVYKARQKSLDRMVALKILPPDVEEAPTFSERFTREAHSLAKLSHPNIVAVYDYGESQGLYYFMMEYVDGTNLRNVQSRQQVKPRQALRAVAEICGALQVAHDQGIVHRDIKPENVLVSKSGRLKIADFGLAKLLHTKHGDESLTTNWALGTPNYMAPEQWHSPATVDGRADIYSVGILFYELLTGSRPGGDYTAPSALAGVDEQIDDVVRKAIQADPEKRYQHASELRKEVIAIMNQSGNRTPSSSVSRGPAAESTAKDWYCARDGERRGPFQISEIRRAAGVGEIEADDLIWRKGWGSEWRPAGQVEELVDAFDGDEPPPLPQAQVPSEASQAEIEHMLAAGRQERFDDAIRLATAILVKSPDCIDALKIRSVAYLRQHQYSKCFDECTALIEEYDCDNPYVYAHRGICCWRLAQDKGEQHASYEYWIALGKSDLTTALKGDPDETYANVLRALNSMPCARSPAMARPEAGSNQTPSIHDRIISAFRNVCGHGENAIGGIVWYQDLDDANRMRFRNLVAHYYHERNDEVPLIGWTNHFWATHFRPGQPTWTDSVLLTTKRVYGNGCINPAKRGSFEFWKRLMGVYTNPYAFEYASLPGPIVVGGWRKLDELRFGGDIVIDVGLSKKGRNAIRDFLEQACALWRSDLSS